jgi:hypothetical protein
MGTVQFSCSVSHSRFILLKFYIILLNCMFLLTGSPSFLMSDREK